MQASQGHGMPYPKVRYDPCDVAQAPKEEGVDGLRSSGIESLVTALRATPGVHGVR